MLCRRIFIPESDILYSNNMLEERFDELLVPRRIRWTLDTSPHSSLTIFDYILFSQVISTLSVPFQSNLVSRIKFYVISNAEVLIQQSLEVLNKDNMGWSLLGMLVLCFRKSLWFSISDRITRSGFLGCHA
jgi:hypothetical protein